MKWKIFYCIFFSSFPFLYILSVNAQVNDWENPRLVSQNSIEPHAHFIPYPGEQEALKKHNSPFIQSLDGIWKFDLSENPSVKPSGFFKDDYDVSNWKKIKVPANWQTEGFDKYIFTDVEYPIVPDPPFVPADYNPVGSYKREFTIPDGWTGKNIFVHFGAVSSFFYLWINGQYVGFSKDSKTPAEFDITKFLRKGINNISVQVYRFSDGTYLEGQDMWKLSGIERSVYLLARPKLSVYDYQVRARLDDDYVNGIFNLDMALNQTPLSSETGQAIQIKIKDQNGNNIFENRQSFSVGKEFRFHTVINNVRKWNAETPNLYTLVINQLDKNGNIVESICQKIGFRTVEIKKGLFLINGVAVKIKGVNRHEHDMVTGKVITTESMLRDITLFKQYNINAMRCSHYPNAEVWYELCDQYGIYVIDEANIECDGMDFHPLKTLSDKPEWKAAYLNRTQRMYERDKNFCSIVTWSLGNESRFGENFIATYQYLKGKDDTRPVQYEEARDNPYTDIFCPMYKNIDFLKDYVKEWRSRPLILCEYAHMMGNSGGNLKDYWDVINKYEQLQGGFIWDFSDQTFKKNDMNGRAIWAYGRDMGNVGATSDTSFCADGLFNADRSPKPQAFELKKVYQPIGFEVLNISKNTVRVTNRYDFTNLHDLAFSWYIKANGRLIKVGKINDCDIMPHRSKEIDLHLPVVDIEPATEYFILIVAKTKTNTQLVAKDFVVASEQFKLSWRKDKETSTVSDHPDLKQIDSKETIKLFNATFAVTFNKLTGWLQNLSYKSKEFFYSPLKPHFWRPATDNDIGNSQQIRCVVWQHATENARLDSFKVTRLSSDQTEIRTLHYLPSVDAVYSVRYIISSNGTIEIKVSMKAGAGKIPEMPRFGMKVLLHEQFGKVKWFGRGPFDNYQDRNYAADIDLYSMDADSLFFPYARAQESGYRTDVRWIALQNKEGLGLAATGKKPLSTGVLHFDMNKMNFDRNAVQNIHGGSMTNDHFIWWNIDYQQMGVGGDNSWGAKTHAEYLLPYKDYEYGFVLKPVYGNDISDQIKQN